MITSCRTGAAQLWVTREVHALALVTPRPPILHRGRRNRERGMIARIAPATGRRIDAWIEAVFRVDACRGFADECSAIKNDLIGCNWTVSVCEHNSSQPANYRISDFAPNRTGSGQYVISECRRRERGEFF